MFKDSYDNLVENQNILESIELLKAAQGSNTNYFTRNRKMNYIDILKYIIISTDERNQKIKCFKYNAKREKEMNISNQGINLQRLKLNPEALKLINSDLIRIIYSKHNYERTLQAKGYYVCAIDGTDIILPNNNETYNYYGGNHSKSEKNQAMASASCSYDVINRHIISSTIHPYRTPECDMALINIKETMELIPNDKKIFVFDRGYISLQMLVTMFKSKNSFLFRLAKSNYKNEIDNMITNDELITIEMTKARLNVLRNMPYYEELLTVEHIVTRCVKFTLSNGEEEILLTDLDNNEFSTEEIIELYRMRWEIETVYNALKHKINLEIFSGYKPIIIEQDFYASIYLWNIMQNLILDERDEVKETSEENHIYEMKINDSLSIEILRLRLYDIFYFENKKEIFNEIISEIVKHIEPIRPNRHFERKSKKDITSEAYKKQKKEMAKRARNKRKIKYPSKK